MRLKVKKQWTLSNLVNAMLVGKDVAYKAVMRRCERHNAHRYSKREVLNEKLSLIASDVKALEVMVAEAKASLERYPDLLPVLKEVGVGR